MIPFTKAHANGNDFLILDESLANRRHAALAQRFCARTTGIGADGIEFVDRRHRSGELFLRLFNADGSEAELSGNGTRCVAAFLAHTEHRNEVILGTHGGPRHCRVLSSSGSVYQIETGMGTPRVMPRSLAFTGLPNGATEIEGAIVNVGNPHFVIFIDTPSTPQSDLPSASRTESQSTSQSNLSSTSASDLRSASRSDTPSASEDADFSIHGFPWQELGRRIATDPRFPHGTNVEFVQVLAPDRIAFRIFERGCGPTASSGTGTCAAAAAAMALRGAARSLSALAEGGSQHVVWRTPGSEMQLTGPAELLCQGQAFDPAAHLRAEVEDLAP